MATAKQRAAAIRALEDRAGRVRPADLVEAASHRRHPMHDDFIWDDAKAAHQQRLNQARQYIAQVRFVTTTSSKTITSVAYVHDPAAVAKEQGYVHVSRLQSERENATAALLSEMVQVQARLERARELAAALELEDQIVDLISGVTSLTSRIRRGPSQPEAPLH